VRNSSTRTIPACAAWPPGSGVENVRVLKRGFTQRYRGENGEYELSRTGGWSDLRRALAPLVREYTIAHGASDADRVRELSTYSFGEWLRRTNAPSSAHKMADVMHGFFLADPEDLSALPLAAELSQGGSLPQTPMYRVAGGTERLMSALAAATDARVLLKHRLQAVRHTADRVICELLDGTGRVQQLEGDAVVMTLPASTLRDVVITPAAA
jgi:monoamine oxidase